MRPRGSTVRKPEVPPKPPAVPPPAASAQPRLTPREEEVLRLLSLGQCNKEIANALTISVSTTKFHMTNLFLKFGVTTRLELLALLSRSQRALS
jgi:DNA-binding CsgD family transcriptional regulator